MILLPVFQSAQNILFRVVELICNIADTGAESGTHHADQIEIDF